MYIGVSKITGKMMTAAGEDSRSDLGTMKKALRGFNDLEHMQAAYEYLRNTNQQNSVRELLVASGIFFGWDTLLNTRMLNHYLLYPKSEEAAAATKALIGWVETHGTFIEQYYQNNIKPKLKKNRLLDWKDITCVEFRKLNPETFVMEIV